MDSRQRVSVLLLLSFFIGFVFAQPSTAINEESAEDSEQNVDNKGSQIQRRSGHFHSGLHYSLPATGYAYAARPYYQPIARYPVIKSFASTPLLHQAPIQPHYHLQHGGASVSSYNVNYPRYPLYRPLLKTPATFVKPNIFSSPGFVYPQKPIIPIAINPVLPTAASPFYVPQTAFNPSLFTGLNPQLIPISVSNGAVFTNYPTLAPTPLSPSAWRPIAVPTIPPTISVHRPSISILPPLSAPSSTIATLADPIHGHHHHQFAHVPTTTSSLLNDVHHHQQHHQQQHQFATGQGDLNELYNYNQGSFTSHGAVGATASSSSHAHSAPSNSYLGPSSYDVDLHNAHQHNEQNNLYHSDGGYQ